MLKVTAIVPYTVFPPKMGGQKGIALFYSYMGKIIPSTLLTTSNTPMPSNYPADIRPIIGKSVLRYINPFLFFTIKEIIKSVGSTHLILEHPYYGWLGILLKKATGIKLVIHSHNI
ncbi:MAG: glycosyl transferase group 1, partial [Ferruginibacter sp.]